MARDTEAGTKMTWAQVTAVAAIISAAVLSASASLGVASTWGEMQRGLQDVREELDDWKATTREDREIFRAEVREEIRSLRSGRPAVGFIEDGSPPAG